MTATGNPACAGNRRKRRARALVFLSCYPGLAWEARASAGHHCGPEILLRGLVRIVVAGLTGGSDEISNAGSPMVRPPLAHAPRALRARTTMGMPATAGTVGSAAVAHTAGALQAVTGNYCLRSTAAAGDRRAIPSASSASLIQAWAIISQWARLSADSAFSAVRKHAAPFARYS